MKISKFFQSWIFKVLTPSSWSTKFLLPLSRPSPSLVSRQGRRQSVKDTYTSRSRVTLSAYREYEYSVPFPDLFHLSQRPTGDPKLKYPPDSLRTDTASLLTVALIFSLYLGHLHTSQRPFTEIQNYSQNI